MMSSACRLCLSTTASHYKTIAAIEEKYFTLVLPEIDINLVQSPMFCRSCIELLHTAYIFKSTCIKTEKMINLYAANHGGRNFLLNDVLQNQSQVDQEIKLECDDDSLGCDVDLSGHDVQDQPEIEIKVGEKEITLAMDQQIESSKSHIYNDTDGKRPFRCEDCGTSFTKKTVLIDHIKRHYDDCRCLICNKSFKDRYGIKRHLSNVHKINMNKENKGQVYTVTTDKDSLDKSLKKHLELYKNVVVTEGENYQLNDDEEVQSKPFKCNICEKEYHKKKYFLDHIRIHFTKYDCKLCSKQFDNIAVLKNHFPTVHQIDTSDDISWRGNISTIIDETNMEEALKMYDEENKLDSCEDQQEAVSEASTASVYICESCGKQFKDKTAFCRHKIIHNDKISSVCDSCQRGFQTKAKFEEHISECRLSIHRKCKLDDNFTCDACGYTTIRKYALFNHIRKHNDERPFKCNMCDKAFSLSNSLSKHKKTAHAKVRLFTCEYCSKSFNINGSLNKHILEVHLSDKIDKKFVCSFCGKKYRLQSQLNSHLRWHTMDKRYNCDICGKAFVDNTSVKKHRVTHFAEKKHKCEICGKGFHQKHNIKIHMKVHLRVS